MTLVDIRDVDAGVDLRHLRIGTKRAIARRSIREMIRLESSPQAARTRMLRTDSTRRIGET